MNARLVFDDGNVRDAVIAPGDVVDTGLFGVIVWLDKEDAEAWRLVTRKRQREINAAMEWAKGKRP